MHEPKNTNARESGHIQTWAHCLSCAACLVQLVLCSLSWACSLMYIVQLVFCYCSLARFTRRVLTQYLKDTVRGSGRPLVTIIACCPSCLPACSTRLAVFLIAARSLGLDGASVRAMGWRCGMSSKSSILLWQWGLGFELTLSWTWKGVEQLFQSPLSIIIIYELFIIDDRRLMLVRAPWNKA